MEIKDSEMVQITSFRRGLTAVAEELEEGKIEKAVVIKNGRPLFVVLTAQRYEELEAAA